jgi:hypothetical protein
MRIDIPAEYKKVDIACEYLDLAMQLFIEQRDFFCIIQLAAAAEELLGMHLPKHERNFEISKKTQISFAALEQGMKRGLDPKLPDDMKLAEQEAKLVVLQSKNKIKHMNEHDDDKVMIAPQLESRNWIDDALINFGKLKLPKSQTQWKYEQFTAERDMLEFSEKCNTPLK